ncbi:MAG: LamG domain-containing protein [Kofleriaceae bacterium]
MNAGVIAITLAAGCSFSPGAQLTGIPDGPPVVSSDGARDAGNDAKLLDAYVAPFCDSRDQDLVACYEFENNLTDGSSHHNDGTANATYGAGKVGNALVINTTNGIDIADSSSFDVTDLTIEAWIYPTAIPLAGQRAGILDNDGQYGFFLHPNGDLICSAGGSVTAQAGIAANAWTHVACTHTNNTVAIYVAGKLVNSAGATALPTGSTSGITLGGNNPPNGGSPLTGSLDQLRLFGTGRAPVDLCHDAGAPNC